jgi:hypothetical protein
VGFQYTRTKTRNPTFGTTQEIMIQPYGDFWADPVIHIRLTGLSVVDNRDRIRYISFVGHKIIKNVQIYFKGIKIDEYDNEKYNIFYDTEVMPEKKEGWHRNLGQEKIYTGFLTPDPQFDMYREYRQIGNGAQTWKQNHDVLDLWIPILFWFKDIRFAVPQIIPTEQTKLLIQLADISEIVAVQNYGGGGYFTTPTIEVCDLYVNNLFMENTIYSLYLQNFNFSLIRVHNYQYLTLTDNNLNNLKLFKHKFPIEQLIVGFRPTENTHLSQYWNKNLSLTQVEVPVPVLIKNPANVISGSTVSATTNSIKISASNLSVQTNYYANYLFVITGGTGYVYNDITKNRYRVQLWDAVNQILTLTTNWSDVNPATDTTWELYTLQLGEQSIVYYEEEHVVETLELRMYDNSLTGDLPYNFYTDYIPYKFGKSLKVPENGWAIINFNLYPLNHNPSGFINFSQTDSKFLFWTLKRNITENNTVQLLVYSYALNFLVIRDAKIGLRYT